MNDCVSKIVVTDLHHHRTLVTRDAALTLFAEIKACLCSKVLVDFTGIDFISRSFADQFHKEKLDSLKDSKVIDAINLNTALLKMFQAVSATQQGRHKVDDEVSLMNFIERKELKHFLLSI